MSINLWKVLDDHPIFKLHDHSGSILQTKQSSWAPSTDINETEKAIIFHSELPGLTLDDVSVEVHNNVLSIKGEKKREIKEEKENCHRVERTYGSFFRSFQLPDGVSEDHVSANLKNGVLEVIVNKPEPIVPPGPKRIAISSL